MSQTVPSACQVALRWHRRIHCPHTSRIPNVPPNPLLGYNGHGTAAPCIIGDPEYSRTSTSHQPHVDWSVSNQLQACHLINTMDWGVSLRFCLWLDEYSSEEDDNPNTMQQAYYSWDEDSSVTSVRWHDFRLQCLSLSFTCRFLVDRICLIQFHTSITSQVEPGPRNEPKLRSPMLLSGHQPHPCFYASSWIEVSREENKGSKQNLCNSGVECTLKFQLHIILSRRKLHLCGNTDWVVAEERCASYYIIEERIPTQTSFAETLIGLLWKRHSFAEADDLITTGCVPLHIQIPSSRSRSTMSGAVCSTEYINTWTIPFANSALLSFGSSFQWTFHWNSRTWWTSPLLFWSVTAYRKWVKSVGSISVTSSG